jgi:hypothetical protein
MIRTGGWTSQRPKRTGAGNEASFWIAVYTKKADPAAIVFWPLAGGCEPGLFGLRDLFLKNGPELRCELRIQAEVGLCVEDAERESKIIYK